MEIVRLLQRIKERGLAESRLCWAGWSACLRRLDLTLQVVACSRGMLQVDLCSIKILWQSSGEGGREAGQAGECVQKGARDFLETDLAGFGEGWR